MRRLILGLGGLLGLAGCNLNIGISGSDTVNASGSATDTDPGTGTATGTATETATGGPGTSGFEPTTASDVSGEVSTTEPVAPSTGGTSTGDSVSSTTDVTVSSTGTEGETFADTMGESSTGGPTLPGDASVHDSCAPNDGPALEFRLELAAATCEAEWADEQLRVMIFQGGPLAPGEYPLAQNGFASLQPKGVQDPITTNDGSLTIVSWDDGGVTGTYTLTFPNAEVREGAFAGPYCPGGVPCG